MNLSVPSFSFQEACALLRDQDTEAVLALLQDERFLGSLKEVADLPPWSLDQNPDQEAQAAKLAQKRAAYLYAWIDALEHRWEAIAVGMLEIGVEGLELYKRTLSFTPRRRRPALWWLLGNLACDLGCLLDSIEHAEQALALLNERRMNVPWLRVQILCDQARAFERSGMYPAAVQTYEVALHQCQHLGAEDQRMRYKPLMGLCELLGQHASTRDRARAYGQQAQALFADARDDEQAPLLYILAGLEEGEDAITGYQHVLTIAREPALRGRTLLRLAQLALERAHLKQAQLYLQQALSLQGLSPACRGGLFQVASHIQASAGFWEAAITWMLKAVEIWPTPETLLALGQLLETILEHDNQAVHLPFWRQAYHRVIKH